MQENPTRESRHDFDYISKNEIYQCIFVSLELQFIFFEMHPIFFNGIFLRDNYPADILL